MNRRIKLNIIGQGQTVEYAAEELIKYIKRIMPEMNDFDISKSGNYNEGAGSGLFLGLFDDFGINMDDLENKELDDAISIDVSGLNGIIAGSNPRSVLFAVYRFLEDCGCHWPRHGADGEGIPVTDLSRITVRIQEKASYRHRGLCIEGAVSFENMLDNIDWAPKLGFNSYFLEFFIPYTFFDRWYSHKNNKYLKPEPVTVEQVQEFTHIMEKEIKKRGLCYHAVGHAWTCEALGIPGLEWEPGQYEVSDEVKGLLAEINGKRELFENIPVNTNLCYSNPEVRQRVTHFVADHVKKNPHIDALHFWLADGSNNHCECAHCRETVPADFYMMMLNELDEEFSKRGIGTKIVFLVYEDLLWAPQKVKLKNPDRFLLLFAPITRSYSHSYDANTEGIILKPYQRNKITLPGGVQENIAYLKEWMKGFHGDSVAYEYYFMWDHFHDPGSFEMARIINEDVKNLRKIGINGIISDQTQRSFFPTGFGMHILGKTLWNEKLEFPQAARDFFINSYGEKDGLACMEYMKMLSELFDPAYMRSEKRSGGEQTKRDFTLWDIEGDVSVLDPDIKTRLARIPAVVEQFRPVIERNMLLEDKCRRKSWEYLRHHADIVTLLARALMAREKGDRKTALELWLETEDLVQRNETELQSVLDVYEFIYTMERKFI